MIGAYVHIPFCARVCPYCDFAVVAGKDDLTERYFAALLAEIEMEPSAGPLGSVFIGGGTPSRVDPRLLRDLIDRLADRFGMVGDVEVSLEANPEDWTVEVLPLPRQAFNEENGQVVMEAESFFAKRDGDSGEAWWELGSEHLGYSWTGYVEAKQTRRRTFSSGYAAGAPQLRYAVNFQSHGVYRVWVRAFTPAGTGPLDAGGSVATRRADRGADRGAGRDRWRRTARRIRAECPALGC